MKGGKLRWVWIGLMGWGLYITLWPVYLNHRAAMNPDFKSYWESQGLQRELEASLKVLTVEIGDRNLDRYPALLKAELFLEKTLQEMGYRVERQTFQVEGKDCSNLEVTVEGGSLKNEIVIVGAHYDSVKGCPGANDNGTGAVATIALARALRHALPDRTLRLVWFVNEEPPYFQTDTMGSVLYARRCRERNEKIAGMVCLETLGCYSDVKGSQKYPPLVSLFHSSTGNFIGFVTNRSYGQLLKTVESSFKAAVDFPTESASLWETLPGVGWSDHWSFWKQGYPALMVTDTAPFRYEYYHTEQDTVDKIDFPRFSKVVYGLESVIRVLCKKESIL